MAHLPLELGAAEAVAAVLADNAPLMRRQVGGELLRFVAELLRAPGWRPSYLRFLRALCSCGDEPLDAHQVSAAQQHSTAAAQHSSSTAQQQHQRGSTACPHCAG